MTPFTFSGSLRIRDTVVTEELVCTVVAEVSVDGTLRMPSLTADTLCDLCRGCALEGNGEDLPSGVTTVEVTACGH